MLRFKTARLKFVAPGFAALFFALSSATVVGAPAVQQVSGTVAHKASVTVAGTGFGTKTIAAPMVWDDASSSSILSKWSGAWPSKNSLYNTTYRTPLRGVGLPHSHITRYIAGAHAEALGADAGYAVMFFKTITVPSYPFHFYVSWYQTVDPAWTFGGDNNFKTFAFSNGSGPYGMPNNWYTEYNNSTFTSPTTVSDLKWHINDDGATLMSPDANGRGWWWAQALNPIAAGWVKQEMAVRLSSQNDGYIKQWENGRLVIDYRGPTDKYPGYTSPPTVRTIGIGGYSRNYGDPTNWRYFADAYFDNTLSRVVLANNQDLASATVVESQIPASWTNSSIAVTVNLGRLLEGQTAYLFVVDSSGAASSVGYPVTIGGSEVKPKPPASITVQ